MPRQTGKAALDVLAVDATTANAPPGLILPDINIPDNGFHEVVI